MIMKTRHTPGCLGVEKFTFQITDLNRGVDDDEYRYLHCDLCGLFRLDNVPGDLGRYYPADYYALPTLHELAAMAAADSFKINTIKSFVTEGRLLEVGPAYGFFAYQAKQAGFDVDVIEMDARCCEHLSKVVGVNAVCSAVPEETIQEMRPHDVIALWHVIEHLPNPWSMLAKAAKNLAPGGILVLAAPNPESWQFAVMGKMWPHIDAPRHLYLIPRSALRGYITALGLEFIHSSTTDSDARGWNRFGWQRFFMNQVRGRWLRRMAYILGHILSRIVAPFEAREPKGSAYTLVFRKPAK